MIIIL
jgi:DNA topoisomerase-1